MNDFFTKKNCDNCGAKLSNRIQSWFSGDVICLACGKEEEEIRSKLIDKNGRLWINDFDFKGDD